MSNKCQIKLKLKKTCTSLEKIWNLSIKGSETIRQKEQKKEKRKNRLIILKTIKFKVMKTIR